MPKKIMTNYQNMIAIPDVDNHNDKTHKESKFSTKMILMPFWDVTIERPTD